jgi:hypothetical protein
VTEETNEPETTATDIWAAYEKRRQQLAQDSAINRATVMEKLKELGVGSVTVNYDGCGDSGQIEDVTFYSASDPVRVMEESELREARVSWHSSHTHVWPQPPPSVRDMALTEAIEGLCYYFLEIHHGGWENNDGAEGEFEFDVAEGTLTLTHRERIMDFDSTVIDL